MIIKKNKACPTKLQRSRGFVILFAVTLSSIMLAIALGVSDIALKEVKFSTSARDTNDAFFAADTGIEAVLFNDKSSGSPYTLPPSPPAADGATRTWGSIVVPVSCSTGATCPCAIVSITKTDVLNSPNIKTTVVSKGYNIGDSGTCSSPNPDRIEREIKVTY